MVQIVETLDEIASRYDAVFCDLWGCLHDGLTAFPEAVEALRGYRAKGGKVVLLTNAPRSRAEVAKQLLRFNVPEDCWDTIATSGDSARVAERGKVLTIERLRRTFHVVGEDERLSRYGRARVGRTGTETKREKPDQASGWIQHVFGSYTSRLHRGIRC